MANLVDILEFEKFVPPMSGEVYEKVGVSVGYNALCTRNGGVVAPWDILKSTIYDII